MKIAVFENEYESVRGAFEASNLISFNNQLKITPFPSSQSFDNQSADDYSVIFIDIDLSAKSQLDGFSLIRSFFSDCLNKVVILTGNNKIESALKSRGLNPSALKIIIKPTDYTEISNAINSIIPAQ